ncbi:hypothetical protein CANMA_001483 [Candida margitis]|uniref:uncharacterized protein n=1 Tax=Candida margitis TaxID=1775924 RepID=UPI00222737F2|nr:uncharacterized protein CANMA_001483 [Candida margitis]KAI5969416.1 hypothetical protein CANMA_001483 [Candida margitis]
MLEKYPVAPVDFIIKPIQDKLLPNPAINQIPSQFIVNSDDHRNDTEDLGPYSLDSGFCCLCTRTRRNAPLLPCQQCASSFHLSCLGISDVATDDYFNWYCPMCDYNQETILPMRPIRRALFSGITRRQTPSSRQLVIRNDNDEIDDSFLYDDEPMPVFSNLQSCQDDVPRASNVINGGVILRREQKLKSRLSEEEVNSWDMFEQARNQSGDDVDIDVFSSTTTQDRSRRRRRRKRAAEPILSPPSPQSLQLQSAIDPLPNSVMQESRISSLIDQLRHTKKQHGTAEQSSSSSSSSSSATATATAIHLALASSNIVPSSSASDSAASMGNSPIESMSYSSDDNEHTQPRELTLEEKFVIQKIVRSKLKPRYKPGSQEAGCISNEEEFIAINKRISRNIYAHIVNAADEMDEFFKNEAKLKQVINEYI